MSTAHLVIQKARKLSNATGVNSENSGNNLEKLRWDNLYSNNKIGYEFTTVDGSMGNHYTLFLYLKFYIIKSKTNK